MAPTKAPRKSIKIIPANVRDVIFNNNEAFNSPFTPVKDFHPDRNTDGVTVHTSSLDNNVTFMQRKTPRSFPPDIVNGAASDGLVTGGYIAKSLIGEKQPNGESKAPHLSRTASSNSIASKNTMGNQDNELAQINSQSEDRLAQLLRMVKLLAAVVLPSIAAITLGIIYMSSAVAEISRINRIAGQIVISHKFGFLVTLLQKERGSSTIYVATMTDAAAEQAKSGMLAARADVDAQFGIIAAETDWRWTNEDPLMMRTKPEFMAALMEHRSLVIRPSSNKTGGTTSLEQIDWYTNVDVVYLAWVTRGFQDFLVLPVVNYKLVLTSKDNIGLVRALGGTYYTQGGFTSGQYGRFIKAFTNGEALLQQATDLSSDLLQVFVKKRTEQAALVDKLAVWQAPILANNSSLEPDGLKGQQFFGNMTSYIDHVIAAIEATTLHQTELLVAAEWKSAITQLVIAIVLVAPVILLGPPLIFWYQFEVGKINKKILTFAKNVAAKSLLLTLEKKKSETLLYQMIPKTVADALRQGRAVEAQAYNLVTIMFSDIVSFTDIAATCTPMQVVELLNTLYTEFDAAIELHDVYKVETIGDAYMCASGLPSTNGDRHAGEIANLALDLLEVSSAISLPVLKGRRLLLRVGVHTGPVVAGVVGTKMPRYCLFGDTVNTASRMESTAEALTVQVSETCASLLQQSSDRFQLSDRGEVPVKGKGVMATYLVLSSRRCKYIVNVEEARITTQQNIFKPKGGAAGFKDMYKE